MNVLNGFRLAKSSPKHEEFCFGLLDWICTEPDENARDLMVSRYLDMSPVRTGLSENKWINALTNVIVNDKSTKVRRRIIGRIYSASNTVAALIENERLHELIDAIAKSQDASRQGMYLRHILSNSILKEHFAEEDALAHLVRSLSGEGKKMFLLQMTEKRDLHQILFDQLGIDAIEQVYGGLNDSVTGARLTDALLRCHFGHVIKIDLLQ